MHKIYSILYIGLLASASCFTAYAQQGTSLAVPSAVKNSFVKVYPGVSNVTWKREKTAYKAQFKHLGRNMTALYNDKGMRLETAVGVTPSALPPAAIDHLNMTYKGASIRQVYKITTANDDVNYAATVNGKTLRFDNQGKLLKH